jgi:hypothetical protein
MEGSMLLNDLGFPPNLEDRTNGPEQTGSNQRMTARDDDAFFGASDKSSGNVNTENLNLYLTPSQKGHQLFPVEQSGDQLQSIYQLLYPSFEVTIWWPESNIQIYKKAKILQIFQDDTLAQYLVFQLENLKFPVTMRLTHLHHLQLQQEEEAEEKWIIRKRKLIWMIYSIRRS